MFDEPSPKLFKHKKSGTVAQAVLYNGPEGHHWRVARVPASFVDVTFDIRIGTLEFMRDWEAVEPEVLG